MGEYSKTKWTRCTFCKRWQRTSVAVGNRRKCIYFNCGHSFKVPFKFKILPLDARPLKPKMMVYLEDKGDI